jgi:hypothetical protein
VGVIQPEERPPHDADRCPFAAWAVRRSSREARWRDAFRRSLAAEADWLRVWSWSRPLHAGTWTAALRPSVTRSGSGAAGAATASAAMHLPSRVSPSQAALGLSG